MSRDVRVADAATAEPVAKRYLESRKKMIEVNVIRVWPPKGKAKGVWEVDGIMAIRREVLAKERKFFRLQIDSETGDVTDLSQ